MADYTITAAQVTPGSGAIYGDGIAGATITAGQSVYLDSTTNTIKLADIDSSVLTAACVGIATHAALAGQPIRYQKAGNIVLGTSAVGIVGDIAIVGGTAGGIAPVGDLAANDFTCILGIWNSDGKQLILSITAPSSVVRGS